MADSGHIGGYGDAQQGSGGDAHRFPPMGSIFGPQQRPATTSSHQQALCQLAFPRVPLFPLQSVALFPGAILPLHIFEQRYRAMAADALSLKCSRTCAGRMDGRKLICMCRIRPGYDPMQDQPPLFGVACLGQIVHYEKLGDGRYNILLQGLCRVRLGHEHPIGDGGDRKPYRRADLHPIHCSKAFEIDVADEREKMKALCCRPPIRGTPVGRQLERLFASSTPTVQLADVLAFDLVEDAEERQRLLEETDERRRVERLWSILDRQFPDPGSLLRHADRFSQ